MDDSLVFFLCMRDFKLQLVYCPTQSLTLALFFSKRLLFFPVFFSSPTTPALATLELDFVVIVKVIVSVELLQNFAVGVIEYSTLNVIPVDSRVASINFSETGVAGRTASSRCPC